MGALVLVSPPANEPVTVNEAKAHLRVVGTDDDVYISDLIAAARRHVETITRRALLTQTWDYALDSFPPCAIEVPLPPLVSVVSIKYLEAATGIQATLPGAAYRVDSKRQPGRITPEVGVPWPVTYPAPNAVEIRFTAGAATTADVPEPIRHAIKLMVGTWYENREQAIFDARWGVSEIPGVAAVQALLRPYVVDYL